MISLIQDFEADFLWKVGLKILKSGIILKAFTHGLVLKSHALAQIYFCQSVNDHGCQKFENTRMVAEILNYFTR